MKKIKPIALVALVIVAVLAIGGGGLAFRAYKNAQGLAGLPTPEPPSGLTSAPTATPPPPTSEPTPQGWTWQTDFAGQKYLAPPPEVEQAVREAFNAVLALEVMEDVPDEVAVQYDREAALEKAARLAVPRLAEYYRACNAVVLTTLGPENPVRCQDFSTCTVGRAKLGSNGAVLYDEEGCHTLLNQDAPCVIRPSQVDYTDDAPYRLFIATIELQDDGVWRVTNLQTENIPEPSS